MLVLLTEETGRRRADQPELKLKLSSAMAMKRTSRMKPRSPCGCGKGEEDDEDVLDAPEEEDSGCRGWVTLEMSSGSLSAMATAWDMDF